mmetsp:Transcript_41748/g.130751  ORF Transcript_41748/g.130751 Transcript_41748/m.130751 type:complete len:223 (-) Transcript_41748:1033-1701(-)
MEMIMTQASVEEEESESTAPGACTPSARPASGGENDTASEETTDDPNDHAINSNDYNPSQLIAFYSSLSKEWERVQERQKLVQRLFESRAAAKERFSFCVLFHVMARMCSRPRPCEPWQIDMSQSNFRVATTAAPVPASDAATGGAEVPVEIKFVGAQVVREVHGLRQQLLRVRVGAWDRVRTLRRDSCALSSRACCVWLSSMTPFRAVIESRPVWHGLRES